MALSDRRILTAPRNVIGGEPLPNIPVEERRSPALRKQATSAYRPFPPTMTVKSPEGVVETHLRFNARDLINIHGWTEVVEKQASIVEDGADNSHDDTIPPEERDEFVDAAEGVRSDRNANPAFAELDELRDKLRARGVTVDMRMGMKKLREQLAALESHDE